MVRAEAAPRLRPRSIADRSYTLLDVFTDRPLAGNGLAVVHDADGLAGGTMHAFARETRLSETAFVQSADGGADYRLRIFTMNGEIPFAGHPSLGTAVAVARTRGEPRATYVQQTGPGEQAVDVELDGLHARASMLQEPPSLGPELDPHDVLGRVGLDGEEATAEMGEDPATGSAVGPLCAHVAARLGIERIDVAQGLEMGRPSRLVAEVDGDRIRVGGGVVILAEGLVHLDE